MEIHILMIFNYLHNGQFTHNVEGTSLLRFLKDSYGTESIAALTDEQKLLQLRICLNVFCETYSISMKNLE